MGSRNEFVRLRCGTGAMYVAGQAVLTSGTTCTAIPIYHLGCSLVCVSGESVEKAWGFIPCSTPPVAMGCNKNTVIETSSLI